MNLNRPLPEPYRDIALLVARVLLGVVMFAHGYQKMIINGIGRTTEGFENLSIPLAIMSASFVTVVEFAGSALLIVGALTPFVSACNLIIMAGAVAFVHGKNGIFMSDGGWELVGVIGVGFILLAAVGPGRYSVDHVVNGLQQKHRDAMERARSGKTGPAANAPWPRAAAGAPGGLPAAPAGTDLWTPPEGMDAGSARPPLPRRAARPADHELAFGRQDSGPAEHRSEPAVERSGPIPFRDDFPEAGFPEAPRTDAFRAVPGLPTSR